MASNFHFDLENDTVITVLTATRKIREGDIRNATQKFVDENHDTAVKLWLDAYSRCHIEADNLVTAVSDARTILAVALTQIVCKGGYDAERVCPIRAADLVIDECHSMPCVVERTTMSFRRRLSKRILHDADECNYNPSDWIEE